MRANRLALPCLISLLACAPGAPVDPGALALGTSRLALGEPTGDYPNMPERQFHYLTNRARIDPQDDLVCKPYTSSQQPQSGFDVPATNPLQYNLNLNQVSRFHARAMALAPCFRHPSCGYLIGSGLDACSSAKPASAGGSCTKDHETYCKGYDPTRKMCVNDCPDGAADKDDQLQTFARFGVFGYHGGRMAENIAAGTPSDATSSFCGFWLEGPTGGPNTAEMHGHFENIVNGSLSEVGHGYWHVGDPRTCAGERWQDLFVQDFGGGAGSTPATIASAAHWKKKGDTQPTFGAIWHSTSAPKEIWVILEHNGRGQCSALKLRAGTAVRGAYEATVAVDAGCHPYYFAAKDDEDAWITYPTKGSLRVGADCTDAYTTDRIAGLTCGPPKLGDDTNSGTDDTTADSGDDVRSSICGVSGAGAPAFGAGLLALVALLKRRRA